MQTVIRPVRRIKTGAVELRADRVVEILLNHRLQPRPVEVILAVAAAQNAGASVRSPLRIPHIGRVGIDCAPERLSP